MSTDTTTRSDARASVGATVAALGIGLVAAWAALIPWLLTGLHLPLQNIWVEQTLPDDMPLALLPLNQYYVTQIAAMLVVGGALAGAVLRLVRRRGRALPYRAAAAGVAVVQLAALAQSAFALQSGLGDDGRSRAYLWALVLGSLFCIALGAGILRAIATAGVAGTAVALAAASIALGFWLDAIAYNPDVFGYEVAASPLSRVLVWAPWWGAAAAAAWSGFVTVRRGVATVAILVMLWVVPALVTAMSYVLTPMYLQFPSEIPSAGGQVFRMALGPDGGAVERMVVAVAIVGAVAVWRTVAARRSPVPDRSTVAP
ncbi:hypothetical protein [Demequina phytophila]|uniref:hypothetical protein n=1 Tax=Demequina phytophila TaxID=1638981 RepID=UPI000785C99C|nr:hypothetical protein [Demequina phytophila]